MKLVHVLLRWNLKNELAAGPALSLAMFGKMVGQDSDPDGQLLMNSWHCWHSSVTDAALRQADSDINPGCCVHLKQSVSEGSRNPQWVNNVRLSEPKSNKPRKFFAPLVSYFSALIRFL